ncbi:unnamed protein product [Parnassius mnemosyne]|uniref:Peptidase A2 domain-containing protein n=1 Tax=Parnassius mnemosyne TaxID=213953 RepID=A0AAV1KCX6_9NEOP
MKERDNIAIHYALESGVHHTTNILLATALVRVTAENGRKLQLRALIDLGSEGSSITEKAAQALGLKKHTINGTISGLGNSTVLHAKHMLTLNLQSEYDKTFNLPVQAYVLKTLTRLLPTNQVDKKWEHIQDLQLAEPHYGTPSTINLLLGAEVYSNIMLEGQDDNNILQKFWELESGDTNKNKLQKKNNNMRHILKKHIQETTKEDT